MAMFHGKTYNVRATEGTLKMLQRSDDSNIPDSGDYPTLARVVLQYQNPLHELISVNTLCRIIACRLKLQHVRFDVTYRHYPNLGRRLCSNHWITEPVRNIQLCFCECIHEKFKVDGHLVTTDPTWGSAIHDILPALDMLKFGLMHVPVRACSVLEILAEYSSVIPALCNAWPMYADDLPRLFSSILHEACDDFECVVQDSDELNTSLKCLAEICTVTPSDKAKGQAVYMCKQHTFNVLKHMISDSPSFSLIQPDFSVLLDSIRHIIPSFPTPAHQTCAIPSLLYKPHKLNYRMLIAYNRCFFTELAVMLGDMSNLVYILFKEVLHSCGSMINQKFCMNIRLDNVVQDSIQAALNIPAWISHPEVYTCDIKNCYDVIPLDSSNVDSIISRMKYVAHMIRSVLPDGPNIYLWIRCLADRKFSVQCGPKKIPGFRKVSLDQWIELLDLLFQNAFVSFNGFIYKKDIGAPQGVHPAPHIINMYLASYELEFALLSCMTAAGRDDVVQLFTNMLRLIDDISNYGGKHAKQILLKVYPPHIISLDDTWFPTIHDDMLGSGGFLNIGLVLNSNHTITKTVLFKEDKLPFVPVQYVHAFSNRSFAFAQNTILGHVVRSQGPAFLSGLNTVNAQRAGLRRAKQHIKKRKRSSTPSRLRI
jgi:hypothetical protein